MDRTVSSDDANRHFPEILGAAARGDKVTITRQGQPVAQLVPYNGTGETGGPDAAVWVRLIETLEQGVDLGGERFDRDTLYGR